MLLEEFIGWVKIIIPPSEEADMRSQKRWQWGVFVMLLGLIGALALHIAISCGFLTGFGVSGFVRQEAFTQSTTQLSTKLTEHTSQLNLIAIQSLEQGIREKLRIRCATKDALYRQSLSDDVSRLETSYYALTSQGYRQPSCEDLL